MTQPHPITRALVSTIMHSAQPMVVTDPQQPDNPMIAVNPAFETLTGYPPAETIGRNCRFLQGTGSNPETTRRIKRCIAARQGCIEWVVNHRRDGSRFWNLLFISPVFAPDGTLLHFFGNQRDITQGLDATVPDYTLGQAEMPMRGQQEFQSLLQGIMDDPDAGPDETVRVASLERIVEAARRLNEVTTRLEPPPWTPPSLP